MYRREYPALLCFCTTVLRNSVMSVPQNKKSDNPTDRFEKASERRRTQIFWHVKQKIEGRPHNKYGDGAVLSRVYHHHYCSGCAALGADCTELQCCVPGANYCTEL